jgi:glycosyltransferase involved in cell wall biosynthesis
MEENRIIVFSATFNAATFINKCILSVKKQKYSNFLHIVIDDATTDSTKDVIKKHNHDKLRVIRNSKNLRWINNAVIHLDQFIESEEDIIFILDGDDWLPHPDTLFFINETYNNTKCWFTYGTFCYAQGSIGHLGRSDFYTDEDKELKKYKKIDWKCYHPRTFKAFLWQNLNKELLKTKEGKYPPFSYDKFLCMPLLEMCPPDKIQFLEKVLYVYNRENILGTNKQKHRDGGGLGSWIRSLPVQDTLVRK